jgi:hypothetical protein
MIGLDYIASLCVPLLITMIDHHCLKGKLGLIKSALVSAVIMIALVTTTAYFYGCYLESKVAALDLNHDGIYAGAELTPEYAKFSSRLINDVSRNFAPFISAALAIIWNLLWFGGMAFFRALRKWVLFKKQRPTVT